MKQNQFETTFTDQWQSFEQMLESLENRKQNSILQEFPVQYRAICQHLSLARKRRYGQQLINYLGSLSERGHQQLYSTDNRALDHIAAYLLRDFPALVRKEWRFVTLSSLLFFIPFIAMIFVILQYPHVAYMIVTPEQAAEYEAMYNPAAERFGKDSDIDSEVMMWGLYIMNNVGISFRCFAGGILAGVGSIFFMLFNGIFIGAVAGHITAVGYIEPFWSFVIGHGSLEITGILLSGAAGLRLGHGIISPGNHTRMESLKNSAKDGLRLLYGASFMIFLASFIEAFWSSQTQVPASTKYTVGALLWLLVFLYFIFAGRRYGTRQA